MKEIIAIIRPKKVSATKQALEELGYAGLTAQAVLGRGNQHGIVEELSYDVDPMLKAKTSGFMEFIPKRFVSIVVEDDMVEPTVNALVKVNQTGRIGDGKIFVCPVDDALRVRTDETGSVALK